jgi:ketosteroid isomerase-like protein
VAVGEPAIMAGSIEVTMSFEKLLSPRLPGIGRDEILRRAKALLSFPNLLGPDISLIRELCSPDIICEFIGDKSRIPYAGRHKGIDTFERILRQIATEFEQLNHSIQEILVDGGRVAVRRTVQWRHRGTGRRGLVELADFARFEDGFIVELVEFRDSITMLSMAG